MSKNIVSVYDTITKRYVEIEVSEKIRTYYNRTQWNIDDNNKSFYKHEIQFSALKGNINGELENFQEFRTENDDVERRVIQNIKCEKLYSCLNELSEGSARCPAGCRRAGRAYPPAAGCGKRHPCCRDGLPSYRRR